VAPRSAKKGLKVISEYPVRINYVGLDLVTARRIDLLVEDCVIVELKAVERMIPLYQSQLLSYLRLTGIRTGLLINFNVRHLRHGIQRVVQ
jgi:GxxExxY protein